MTSYTYERSPLLDLIDTFEDMVGFHVANTVAHIVIEDYNLLDEQIDRQIDYIEENRAEWVADANNGVNDVIIEIVIGFLRFLKTIPEETRDIFVEIE